MWIATEKGAWSYLGQVLATGGMQVTVGGTKVSTGGMQVARGRDMGGSLSHPARFLEASIRRR